MGDGYSRGPYGFPEPSPTAKEAAKQLLALPEALGLQVQSQIREISEGLKKVEMTVRSLLVAMGLEHKLPPLPANYFLNEQHTTHITKSQARKERAEHKKQVAAKAAKRPAVARKSRTPSARNRR